MKATELMIGDWVFYDNHPHQIWELGIFGEDRDGDSYPAVCVGKPAGIGLILERNEIEPIPLTADILEKNFDFEPDCDKKIYKNKSYSSFLVMEEKNGFSIGRMNESYETPQFNGWFSIGNVHELQHALKLCGIDKQILL